MNILEDLKDQLKSEEDYMTCLIDNMKHSIETRDYDHICRVAAEASQIKGRIETLKKTIYMIEKSF